MCTWKCVVNSSNADKQLTVDIIESGLDQKVSKSCIENNVMSTHNQIMLYVDVGKTNCIRSIAEFMRLVRRGDNPNKETLIYIHTLYLMSPSIEFIQPELLS